MPRIKKEFHLRYKSGPDSLSASEEKARCTVYEPTKLSKASKGDRDLKPSKSSELAVLV